MDPDRAPVEFDDKAMFEALADLSTAIVLAAALALTAVAPASAATPTVVKCVSVLDANGELMHRSAW